MIGKPGHQQKKHVTMRHNGRSRPPAREMRAARSGSRYRRISTPPATRREREKRADIREVRERADIEQPGRESPTTNPATHVEKSGVRKRCARG